ncbi:MAG: endonuclease/exonuclease/phosphatase family protein [Bacteroidaceae bacterium]|nr:endonuclease/exonuclease/phosphatase family protein [Bacteroidaceae bacterium]
MGLLKTIGRLLRHILLGANMGSVALMLLCGLSTTIHPENFPILVAFGLTFPFYLVVNVAFLVIWLLFRARYVWISVAGLLLGAGFVRTYVPLNIPNPHPKGSIKIMSYNVHSFTVSEEEQQANTPNSILQYVKKSEADIICFQEYQNGRRKVREEVDQIRSKWKYSDTVHFSSNALALWSRFPILHRQKIQFPAESHGSIAYTLKLPSGDTIIVINNHFISNSMTADDKSMYRNLVTSPEGMDVKGDVDYLTGKIGQAGVRRANLADSIVKFLDHHPDCPVILCGDLNDSPISYPHQRLTSRLTDAYVASGNGPGISYHLSGMYFRLDNILCSPHWESYSAKVDNSIDTSDHYPIFCYLKLKQH